MTHKLISGERHLPLTEFHLRTQRIARGLVESGVMEGDSVALLLRNDIAFLEATFGAALIGAYSVPINWHFKKGEIEYVLDNCGAKVIVIHSDLTSKLPTALAKTLKILVVPTPPEIQLAYDLKDADCTPKGGSIIWESWWEQFTPWTEPAAPARGSMIYTSGTTGTPKLALN